MLFSFILKQEINFKKLVVLFCSPMLLFIFEVDNSFSYIRYFEAILPMFYIFIFCNIPLYAEEVGMSAFENATPYSNYKVYLCRTGVNLIIFIVNVIYSYIILRVIAKYKFDMGEIFVGENAYSAINSGLIFFSGLLSLLFYISMMNFLQFFLNQKWLSLVLIFAFSIMNMVSVNVFNINAIYYYGNNWLYIKIFYLVMIVVFQFTIFKMEDIKFKLKEI